MHTLPCPAASMPEHLRHFYFSSVPANSDLTGRYEEGTQIQTGIVREHTSKLMSRVLKKVPRAPIAGRRQALFQLLKRAYAASKLSLLSAWHSATTHHEER